MHRLTEGNNELIFIQNGKKIDINEERKVKDVFLDRNLTIMVVRIDSIIGA